MWEGKYIYGLNVYAVVAEIFSSKLGLKYQYKKIYVSTNMFVQFKKLNDLEIKKYSWKKRMYIFT